MRSIVCCHVGRPGMTSGEAEEDMMVREVEKDRGERTKARREMGVKEAEKDGDDATRISGRSWKAREKREAD